MQTKLGRDVFLALAGVAWADGKMSQDEADAIVKMAVEEGLDLEEIAEIEEATKNKVEVGTIDIRKMKKLDRLFIYAVGTWIARIDGYIAPGEITALNRLADTLKLPDIPRERADQIAIEVAKASGSEEPAFFKLSALRFTLREKLEEAKQLRQDE